MKGVEFVTSWAVICTPKLKQFPSKVGAGLVNGAKFRIVPQRNDLACMPKAGNLPEREKFDRGGKAFAR